MSITVKEALEIIEPNQGRLIAGRAGISRVIYYVDAMEQPDMEPWMRPDVFLITTGYVIRNDKNAVLKLIRQLHTNGAAGLAIKGRFFDEFPKEAIPLADSLELPLILINDNISFIDISYPIMMAIIDARNKMSVATRFRTTSFENQQVHNQLFSEILEESTTQQEWIYKVNALFWPKPSYRVASIAVDRNKEDYDIRFRMSIMGKVMDIIKKYMQKSGYESIVVVKDDICTCIFHDMQGKKQVYKVFEKLKNELIAFTLAKYVTIGISKAADSYEQLRESYKDSKTAIEISRKVLKDKEVVLISDVRFEQILRRLCGDEEVVNYTQEKLARIEQHDEESDSHLMETLEAFVKNMGAKKITAEQLYLHRNTLTYRLQKIESIIGNSLEEPEEMFQIYLALKIKKHL